MPKTLLITGASAGLGAAIARHAAMRGYRLLLTARRADALRQVAAACREAGAATVATYPLDLADSAAVTAWLAALPPVDVFISNAGFGLFKAATACTDAENSAMLRLNVLAAMQISAALVPPMQVRGGGQLIFVASQAGKIATPKAAVYAASKHALLGYANALRLELRGSGVTVTTVNPGPMATAFFDTADPGGNYREKLGRFWLLDPERIAALTIAAIGKNVREINRPRLMEAAARLYPLAPRLGDWLTATFFNRK
ncbi:SDR family NAD(P)-dependent oxidoreductase [uncultured Cardiobacterium sp.]|uniref:SDR family NAD(P)-dependent oxidoreductase n=1 Tax=uncultured Cardiobacterium sp. TaxID=417619 RepID=UPI00261D4482|nr:SDR family NAD(P)-dependent oxidoreductase [uncultured Cardiobacterium sp.]